MEYLKSSRFLALIFFVFSLIVACVSMITVSKITAQWQVFRDEALSAEAIEDGGEIEASSDQDNAQWVVRAHEERIGVFDINGELEYIVDVYLITLPPADQKLLQQGIYVSDADQLTALMEDYTG